LRVSAFAYRKGKIHKSHAMTTAELTPLNLDAAELLKSYFAATGTRATAADRLFPSLWLFGCDRSSLFRERQHPGFELENPFTHGP
jgi:hypothetical protein